MPSLSRTPSRRAPILQAAGLAVGFLLAACLLCAAYFGILHLRHRLQARFGEMHALLDEEALPESSQADLDRRDGEVPSLHSALDWAVLSPARMEFAGAAAQPVFTPAILAMDGTHQKVTGYMFPLSVEGGQGRFLLSPYPSSCPFCLPAGPSELIEVVTKDVLPFTYEPVTVEGRFRLLRKADDIGQGMFYRMEDAARSRP